MNLSRICPLILLFGFFFSCANEDKEKTDRYVIPVDPYAADSVKLSSLAESTRYITLDVDIENYMSYPRKIVFYQDRIFCLGYNDYSKYFIGIYTETGKKVGVISGQGKGPGEFLEINDFLINPYQDRIELLSGSMQKKILRYDLNGVFIDEIQIPHITYYFSLLNDSAYYIHNTIHFARDKEGYNVHQIDYNTGQIANQIIPCNPLFDNVHSCDFFRRGEKLGIHIGIRDTLFVINQEGEIDEQWFVDFGPKQAAFFKAFRHAPKNSKQELDLLNDFDGRSSFGDFKSTDDYLWFYYSVIEKNAGRLHHSYIYHWSSGKSWNCHGIINDIDQVAIGLRPMTTTPDGEMVFRVNTSKTNPESDTIVLAIVTMKEG